MAKRKRKKKPVTLSHLDLRPAFVDNPDWRPDLDGEKAFPRKVAAMVNVKESAIATLASRRDREGRPLIDPGQVAAADLFRRHWETTGGTGAQAIDYSRTKVDGGHIADPIDIARMKAARHLAEAERTLGERNYELVRRVCGEGAAMTEIFDEKRARLTATDNLRNSLDDLAKIWGIAVTASSRPSRKYDAPPKDDTPVYNSRTSNASRGAKTG